MASRDLFKGVQGPPIKLAQVRQKCRIFMPFVSCRVQEHVREMAVEDDGHIVEDAQQWNARAELVDHSNIDVRLTKETEHEIDLLDDGADQGEAAKDGGRTPAAEDFDVESSYSNAT